jgi:hypothetical protein
VRSAVRKLGVDRITASPNPDGSWTISGGLDLAAIISGQAQNRNARGV